MHPSDFVNTGYKCFIAQNTKLILMSTIAFATLQPQSGQNVLLFYAVDNKDIF